MNNHGGICILLRLLKVGYNGATWQTRIQDLLIKDQDQDSAVSRPRPRLMSKTKTQDSRLTRPILGSPRLG